jgi:Protein of unknown function (DUF2783)
MNTQPNFSDPDGFYERLVNAHEGLNAEQSAELNARLILLLANQIGDAAVLYRCVDAALKPFASARRES